MPPDASPLGVLQRYATYPSSQLGKNGRGQRNSFPEAKRGFGGRVALAIPFSGRALIVFMACAPYGQLA